MFVAGRPRVSEVVRLKVTDILMKTSRFIMELSDDLTELMELEEGLPYLQGGIVPQALAEA